MDTDSCCGYTFACEEKARAVGLFSVSAVVGAAVPAAVCRWGLARAVLMWGGVSRGYTIIIKAAIRDR